MKLLPGRSHSVWVWDPCKYSLSLTLHQRKRFNSYSSRLDRLECSSSIFHASQLWCLFQSHGVFKICLLGTHLQCLLALDPEGLCFQAFLRSILTNECRLIPLRSSLGSRMWGFREGRSSSWELAAGLVFLAGRIVGWLRGGWRRVPAPCTGSLALSSVCAWMCTAGTEHLEYTLCMDSTCPSSFPEEMRNTEN